MKTGPIKYRRHARVLPLEAYKDRIVLSPANVRVLQIVIDLAQQGKPITINRIHKKYSRVTKRGIVRHHLYSLRKAGLVSHAPGANNSYLPACRYIPAKVFFKE